jgi:hypothetical protein
MSYSPQILQQVAGPIRGFAWENGMSKTAGCVFALGVCMVLAAACGDDDGGPATGGNGGAAGAGGGAGSGNAGRAGSGGAGGAPLGGSGGTPSGGASGAPAGAAGEGGNGGSAGTGDEPDGGVPDGGDVVVGDCPAFATAALAIEQQNNQQLAIARVLFNSDGTADVVVRNPIPAGGDASAGSIGISVLTQVCSGESDNDCVALSEFEEGEDFVPGQERTVTVDAVPAAGEIAVLSNVPSEVAFAHAYIAWGANFVSVAPTGTSPDGGVLLSLEARAFEAEFWLDDPQQRIVLAAGQNTIVGDGDTALDAGFTTCTR